MEEHRLEIDGFCPICERDAKFVARGTWYRGTLKCLSCEGGSVPRERALALVLNRERPNWRELSIHESSPAVRGVSLKLRRECQNYLASHYYPDKPFGAMVDGWRNENIEDQTFPDESFDIVVSLDVTEHVFRPGMLFKEIHRTLKKGGLYISTFPIRKRQIESHEQRARLREDGSIEHLIEPEFHGNPIDGNGVLVTYDYGYSIHQMIPHWAPFDVEIARFNSMQHGILGEYTEVIICRK